MTGRPRPRRRVRTATLVSAGTALALAAGLTWHASYASFSRTTAPLVASVGTGTLVLTDDDTTVRMFTATGLRPGATATECIAVSSSGSPAKVLLYGTGRSSTNGLSAQLDLNVSLGTGGSSRTCTGFQPVSTAYDGTLSAFPVDGWASGVGAWTTTTGTATTRVYRIRYTLRSTAPVSVQNGRASLGFVWEARTK